MEISQRGMSVYHVAVLFSAKPQLYMTIVGHAVTIKLF